jgi:nitrite reductase (NO-forming)
MTKKLVYGISALVPAAVVGAALFGFSGMNNQVETTDFGVVKTAVTPAFNAELKPASSASVKEFIIPVTHDTIEIADGVKYVGWTFGGTVPGPTIRVREGDLVRITLVNKSDMPHSIDFHSARIPMDKAFKNINPGEDIKFEFVAQDPGAYMVHCGTAPVLMHLMQGMYLAIIVDPKEGWGEEADKEFVLVQSEFYAQAPQVGSAHTAHQMDYKAAEDKRASHVVFNGKAFQYKNHPLKVNVGDRVRLFVVNAGPSLRSDFHVVGTIFDKVYPDGNPANALESVQTQMIPAGGGAVFETVFDKDSNGEGVYAFVTHAFADAQKGAVGVIQVGNAVMAGGGH